MLTFVKVHFLFFGVLTAIVTIPTGLFLLFIISVPMLTVPALVAITAPTILLYSITLVPLGAVLATRRHLWMIPIAIAFPAAIAIAPGKYSNREVATLVARTSADDLSRPGGPRPRSIELVGDLNSAMFSDSDPMGSNSAPCNNFCRSLLFNGEVDWVRVKRAPKVSASQDGGVIYRLEHRNLCPEVYPKGTRIAPAVRDRLLGGDCLIVEPGGDAVPEAVVGLVTLYSDGHDPRGTPPDATIQSIRQLEIRSAENGNLSTVRRQTEIKARAVAQPFYFAPYLDLQGHRSGLAIGYEKMVTNPIDLPAAIRETLGYALLEVSAPPQDTRKIVEDILALSPEIAPIFSTAQRDVIDAVISKLRTKADFSDADVEITRRVLADRRALNTEVGVAIQFLLLRHPKRFEALLPVLLDRIADRVPAYSSSLSWSLSNFAADSLRPYREKMIRIAEEEQGQSGVMTRLGELESDDAIRLVIQRLGLKGTGQSAAIAACRATADAWRALEPAVLAQVKLKGSNRLDADDELPMLYALTRYGAKAQAIEIIENRKLVNGPQVIGVLSALDPGFEPALCRNRL